MVKTPDGGTFAQGAQVSYTIVVSNPAAVGAQSATNVNLTDALPGNGGLVWQTATTTQGSCTNPIVGNTLSCALGTIAPQRSVTVTVTSTATTPAAVCQSQPNPAAIATADGGLTAQDAGSLDCKLQPAGNCDLSLQKTASSSTFQIPDGASCQNVQYSYKVTNKSNDSVKVTLADDKLSLGADGTFTLAVNGTKTITKTACLSQATTNNAIATGTLVNSPDATCSAVASATVALETCKGSVVVTDTGGHLVWDKSKGIAYADLKNNSTTQSFLVGMASYKEFDAIIDNQQINDSTQQTIAPGQTLRLQVKLPTCATQIDLFCGQVLQSLNGQRYNDRKLDYLHINEPNYCTTGGTQGCSPGYWKNHTGTGKWPAPYTSATQFSAVFDNAFPNHTLLWVLQQGGGGLTALGRQTVAALLNAKALGSNYAFAPGAVIGEFNGVYPGTSSSYDTLQNQFDSYNDKNGKSCPLH